MSGHLGFPMGALGFLLGVPMGFPLGFLWDSYWVSYWMSYGISYVDPYNGSPVWFSMVFPIGGFLLDHRSHSG